MPFNSHNEQHDNKTEKDLISMFFSLLIVIAIFFIIQSSYLQTFTYELIIGFGLLGVAFGKFITSYQTSPWYIILYTSLILISTWLITMSSNDDNAWWGCAILMVTILVDIVYTLYMKYSMKQSLGDIGFWSSVIGGGIAFAALAYALLQ